MRQLIDIFQTQEHPGVLTFPLYILVQKWKFNSQNILLSFKKSKGPKNIHYKIMVVTIMTMLYEVDLFDNTMNETCFTITMRTWGLRFFTALIFQEARADQRGDLVLTIDIGPRSDILPNSKIKQIDSAARNDTLTNFKCSPNLWSLPFWNTLLYLQQQCWKIQNHSYAHILLSDLTITLFQPVNDTS